MMIDDSSDWYGLEQNGLEWISTRKYAMKPDGSRRIGLGQKVTGFISTLSLQYGM